MKSTGVCDDVPALDPCLSMCVELSRLLGWRADRRAPDLRLHIDMYVIDIQ